MCTAPTARAHQARGRALQHGARAELPRTTGDSSSHDELRIPRAPGTKTLIATPQLAGRSVRPRDGPASAITLPALARNPALGGASVSCRRATSHKPRAGCRHDGGMLPDTGRCAGYWRGHQMGWRSGACARRRRPRMLGWYCTRSDLCFRTSGKQSLCIRGKG